MSVLSLRRWFVAAAAAAAAVAILGTATAPGSSLSAAPAALVCEWTTADRQNTGHYHAANAYDSQNNAIYYFGGVDQSGDASSFLGALDTTDPDITKASMATKRPSGLPQIYGAAGFFRVDGTDADKSAAYFVGGSKNGQLDEGEGENSVYRYTPASNVVDILTVSGNLPDVLHGAVAYDPDNNQAVFYGGTSQCSAVNEPDSNQCAGANQLAQTRVLKFDDMGGATWTQVQAGSRPGSVYGHSMVYDSANKQMLLFGGTTDGGRANGDVYALALAPAIGTWTRIAQGGPRARFFHSAAYDSNQNWMIISGGIASGLHTNRENTFDDTWALDMTDPAMPTWVDLDTSPLGVKDRVGASMAFAANAMSAVVHGGRSKFQAGGNRPTGNSDGLICVDLPDTPTPPPATARPTAGPRPTGGAGGDPWVPPAAEPASCPQLQGRVPDAAVAAALANPPQDYMLCNPNVPIGPDNLYRDKLSLQDGNKPYHPIFNRLQWKCGCQ